MPGAKPKTISDYIAGAAPEARLKLRELLDCLRKVAPGAEESLKWGMPALSYDRILFMFAAFKKHISFFPTPSVTEAFAKELAGFNTSEGGTIQFPLDQPLPLPLIRRIAGFRIKEVREKDAKWK